MQQFRFFFLFFLSFIFSLQITAQDLSLYQKKVFKKDTATMPYRLLLPENFDAKKKYPLLLFLHGAGERGNDNEIQLVHGAELFLRDSIRKNYPAIIVFPQCQKKQYWARVDLEYKETGRVWHFPAEKQVNPNLEMVDALLKNIKKEYKIDKKRIYVGGLSMGGMGTFEIVLRNPKLFAAAMPICGGANPAIASKIKGPKWWIFHGQEDSVVPHELSKNMYEFLKDAKAEVKFNSYPSVDHDSWTNAFAEPDLLEWLFAQSK